MKIKDGYMLREMAGNGIVVPVGDDTADFNGAVTLNETGAFLWKQLQSDKTAYELAKALADNYEVSDEDALKSVERFIKKLKEADLIE